MIPFPDGPPAPSERPVVHYCGVCGRTVRVTPTSQARRHLNLDTGKLCSGSDQAATTNPDPDTPRKAPNPTATPRGEQAEQGADTPIGGQSGQKRAGEAEPPEGFDQAVAAGTIRIRHEDRPRRGKRVSYTDEEKAAAIHLMDSHGIAAANDMLDIPRQTLSDWARAANLDLSAVAVKRVEGAHLALKARVAERKLATVAMLEDHLGNFGHYLGRIAEANAAAAEALVEAGPESLERKMGLTGSYVVTTDTTAADAANMALALAGLPLNVREAEGVVTRAIHDLQLLKGEATERGEIQVQFRGVPRPDPTTVEVVQLDAKRLDEDYTK